MSTPLSRHVGAAAGGLLLAVLLQVTEDGLGDPGDRVELLRGQAVDEVVPDRGDARNRTPIVDVSSRSPG
jgi:hypothetical protein